MSQRIIPTVHVEHAWLPAREVRAGDVLAISGRAGRVMTFDRREKGKVRLAVVYASGQGEAIEVNDGEAMAVLIR